MSSTKDHLFEIEEERMRQWILEKTGGRSVDERSEEWQDLVKSYSDYQDYLADQAEFSDIASEIQWLEETNQNGNYALFLAEIDAIQAMVKSSLDEPKSMAFLIFENTLVKMAYAHAVTLLESFLGDTLKSLIVDSPDFLSNAMKEIKEVSEPKYSLYELSKMDIDLRSLTLKHVSEILFHNIPKVIKIYGVVLGKKLSIDLSEIVKITSTRHDIVHRNGHRKDGTNLNIRVDDLYKAISEIKNFADSLQNQIYTLDISDGSTRWRIR